MKYMGSKNRIAKYILPIILKDRKPDQWYVEPFAGGCNMIDKVDGKRIGGDVNNYLISFWKAIQKGWKPPEFIEKQIYKNIISNKNDYAPELVGWVTTACTYSGTGHGYIGILGKRNYQAEAHRNLLKQRKYINGIELSACEYFNLYIPPNSLIYCDPPYENCEHYRNFKTIKFDDFWQWCRKKAEDGHKIFISEYNAPDDFICIWQKEVKSSLSANGKSGGNKNSIEKLFVHKSCSIEFRYI